MPYLPYFKSTIPLSCLTPKKPEAPPVQIQPNSKEFDQAVMNALVKYLQQQSEKKS